MQEQLSRLRDLTARHARGARTETAIPRVTITVAHAVTPRRSSLFQPTLCLVLQGAKDVMIGERRLRYDPACTFIATLELPASGQIVEASPERPYIGVALGLDGESLAALLPDLPGRPPDGDGAGFAVSPVTPQLLDAWQRFLGLLDTPGDIPVLAPLCEREILYRFLQGPQGAVLRQIARADSRLSRVRQAIAWIRTHFDRPLRIEALAERAGMSPASFHRHFRAATAMSPLQYQKSLRLQRARSLLVADPNAARAAYAVGYESPSQFSREYTRAFGVPPARDAGRLRGDAAALTEVA